MQKNYKLWLVVSVLLAAIAAFTVVTVVQKHTGTTKVIVAKDDLQATQIISNQTLAYKEIPSLSLYPDVVTSSAQIGEMVTKGFIPKGTVLRTSMFDTSMTAQMSGKIALLGKGYRAVALPKQLSTTIASTLNEGDTVDIYFKKEEKDSEVKVIRIASDIEIMFCRGKEGEEEGVVLAIKEEETTKTLPYFYEPENITFVLKPIKEGEGS